MKDLNSVRLVGTIEKRSEFKTTNNGFEIATLYVGTNQPKQTGGRWGDNIEIHKLTAFGDEAETARKLSVGTRVFIDGRLRSREYVPDRGEPKLITDMQVRMIEVLGDHVEEDKGEGLLENDAGTGTDDIPF